SLPTEFYSAQEVLNDPWSVALEVIGLLGTRWPEFEPVPLPPTLRSLAMSFARAPGQPEPPHPDSGPATPPAGPLSTLDYVRRVVRTLSPAESTSDPAMRALRRDYPRA